MSMSLSFIPVYRRDNIRCSDMCNCCIVSCRITRQCRVFLLQGIHNDVYVWGMFIFVKLSLITPFIGVACLRRQAMLQGQSSMSRASAMS